ncbi:concanavalin A-like lectin/glucanase [Microthyrium microscopicum]|uniref:Concanavalin A-like lectin/glucanase n=1 Tax=Microthyrium microscopicum TaxID=703497 RepID=A0A6A6TX67_9PEZI|nr:concanavalin A-like lectin/glucanase [Microthyrium microscopicum]
MHMVFPYLGALLFCASYAASVPNPDNTICTPTGSIPSDNNKLIFIANAWNATPQGFQCISVNSYSTAFNATWQWPSDRNAVHSYPHVKFQPKLLPIVISDISAVTLSASWSISAPAKDLDSRITGMVSNVAWDMFADEDPAAAQVDASAKYEVMVWVGRYGDPKPIGFSSGLCQNQTVTVGDTSFSLYCGSTSSGSRNLTTYSWVANSNVSTSHIDFLQLLKPLVDNNLLASSLSLGVIGFGSEAYYAPENVTFMAQDFGVNLTSKTRGSEAASLGLDMMHTKFLAMIMVACHVFLSL